MADKRNVTMSRQMPALQMRAEFNASTLDADKRTVDMTWTTGARVMRGFWDPYLEELSLDPKHVRMGRLQSGNAPLLNSHRSYDMNDVIGVVEKAQLDPGGKSGSATVRFDSGTDGSEAMRKVKEGILRNVSVGYRVHKLEKVKGAVVDSNDDTPVFRATDWEPFELSMVPIGADAGAATRADSAITNPCEFTEERTMPEPEKPITPPPAPALAVVTDIQRAEIQRAERERGIEIQRIARSLSLKGDEASKAIADGTAIDEFRKLAIDAREKADVKDGGHTDAGGGNGGIRVQAGEASGEKWARGIQAALFARCGSNIVGAIRAADTKTGEKTDLDGGEFRGMRMRDLAVACLDRANVKHRGRSTAEIIGMALTAQRSAGADSFFTNRAPSQSTSDFTFILENTLHKLLLAQYAITPDTWRKVCIVGSGVDFRPNPRYRMGSIAVLSVLNELGEFVNTTMSDAEKQSITIATQGNILALSRQTLINDDMSAFSRAAMMFGRAAALSIEVNFYASLALNSGLGPNLFDGNPMFAVGGTRNNVTTGAALGSTAIDLDRVAMGSQKDPSGNELLDLDPAVILLPKTLGGTMRQINNGEYDFDALSTKNPWVPNKVRNVVRDVVDTARLSGTRRYMFADPGIAPAFEVIFLDGQEQPYMEMQQGWRTDGVEWKIRLDFAVGGIDFRGAVTNAGA